MPGSVVDLQTVAQNIAQNLNQLSQTWLTVNGAASYPAIAATTLVKNTAGRLVRISITTAGTTAGIIYDAQATGLTTRPVYSIPNTLGVVELNFPMGYGIVVVPGTGQVVTVTYS